MALGLLWHLWVNYATLFRQKIVVAGGIAEIGVEHFTLPTEEDAFGQRT